MRRKDQAGNSDADWDLVQASPGEGLPLVISEPLAASSRPASVAPLQTLGPTEEFSPADKFFLLQLARQALTDFVCGTSSETAACPGENLTRKRGCFVTLTCGQTLRGCIGNVLPVLPLYRAVQENARAAASRDPRFPPVCCEELPDLRIEISVLTDPQPLVYSSPEALLRQLHPGTSGVFLQIQGRIGTFLPQVWEMVPDKIDFLNRLSVKAGFPPQAWREPGAAISVYEAQHFEEHTETARP